MNSTSMKYYEGLIKTTVHDLLAALDQRQGEEVDISVWMTYFGYVVELFVMFALLRI